MNRIDTSRRQFLVRAVGALGALITPAFVVEAQIHIAHTATPLLRPTATTTALQTLWAEAAPEGGYRLGLGLASEAPLGIPWRELLSLTGFATEAEQLAYLSHEARGDMKAQQLLDQSPPNWFISDWWERHYSPDAKARHYLARLDLGPAFAARPDARGEVVLGGYRPAATLAPRVVDDLSLSLLQARLAELAEPVRIVCKEAA